MSAPVAVEVETAHPLVRHRYLILLLLSVVVYVLWLGNRDLWYPDEPDVAEVCQAMFTSGDWVAPRYHGEIWIDYPPMLYWAGSASSVLFGGITEFTLRLPSAIAGVLLVLLTACVTNRWFGPRAGLFAGLVLLASPQFGMQAVAYRPDTLFSLFVAGGMLVYAAGVTENGRWLYRGAGFAMLGLAILTKGPLGLLLPGLAIVLWHGFRREWRRILELVPLTVVAVAVALPWFIAVGRAMGFDEMIHDLGQQNFRRFHDAFKGHERPFLHYAGTIWFDMLPFVFLLPAAVIGFFRSRRSDRHLQFALWWFGAFLVFLSFAKTKRGLYLVPAYPAVAVFVGAWLSEQGASARAGRIFAAAAQWALVGIAALLVGIATAPLSFFTGYEIGESMLALVDAARWPLAIAAIVGLAAAAAVHLARRNGDLTAALLRLGVGYVLLFGTFLAVVYPVFNPVKTYVPQCAKILEMIGDEPTFGLIHHYGSNKKRGAFAFYTKRPVATPRTDDELNAFFDAHPDSIVLMHSGLNEEFFRRRKADFDAWTIGEIEAARIVYRVLRRP
ncbi:MAG: glycosyltransferase family 39 protein [Planctomycetota bacterium]